MEEREHVPRDIIGSGEERWGGVLAHVAESIALRDTYIDCRVFVVVEVLWQEKGG